MSEKQKLIQKLIEMQKKFIEHEHEHGVEAREYYASKEGEPLAGYRDEYTEACMKLVDLAHEEKGSHR